MGSARSGKPKCRRWFQWSLRTLLLLVLVVGVGLGWLANERQRVKERFEAIDFYQKRGRVRVSKSVKQRPDWLCWLLNDRYAGRNVTRLDLASYDYDSYVPLTSNVLARVRHFERLKELELTDTEITDEDLAHLSGLRELKVLSVSGTKITNEGLGYIRDLRQLQFLFLDNTKISDAGLSQLRSLTNLKRLSMDHTEVSDAGLLHLSDLAQLRMLEVWDTNVTPEGIKKLKKANPNLAVRPWKLDPQNNVRTR